jgi:hypothetical protein
VRHRLLVVASTVLAATAAHAVELTLAPRALAEAIDLGQSRIESLRTTFHQPYRVRVSRPPVDYVEVVTPFRRVVLAAETRARGGDRRFGQREARDTLATAPDEIDLLVELTFHPQTAYIAVPAYDVRLLAAGTASPPAVQPIAIDRVARFGPRLAGALTYPYAPGVPAVTVGQLTGGQLTGGQLTGGTLVARLDGRRVGSAAYDLFVVDRGTELARARIDFQGMR